MADFHPAGMKTMARALAEADLRDVLPEIELPTLLLYGAKDVRSPLSIGGTARADTSIKACRHARRGPRLEPLSIAR
jgi:pimeloyl-ACP methyl ester carboxylesterase